jgi:DNA polymerase III epsilon subunit-like protein
MTLMPVVLDIETSGLDKVKCGVWQIGAIDLNTMEEFIQESKIDDDDVVDREALLIIGKTEEELRDPSKQSQMNMINNFFKWMERKPMRNVLCQNPQFDVSFLEIRAEKYGLKKTFQHRAFDLHTAAQVVYASLNGEFLTKGARNGETFESDMNLTNVLKFCGLPDNRVLFADGKKIHEGNPHNALEDCKLSGECFFRLIVGKNLFDAYSKYEIPKELIR